MVHICCAGSRRFCPNRDGNAFLEHVFQMASENYAHLGILDGELDRLGFNPSLCTYPPNDLGFHIPTSNLEGKHFGYLDRELPFKQIPVDKL